MTGEKIGGESKELAGIRQAVREELDAAVERLTSGVEKSQAKLRQEVHTVHAQLGRLRDAVDARADTWLGRVAASDWSLLIVIGYTLGIFALGIVL